jgi:indolepyruvate ferredoxin oxidoreductase beta subunit
MTRPITILIGALGGEGGGVLTDWIVTAAAGLGFPVQSTSIPGVAQRTGATTYYIEIVPVPARELNGKRPVLALTPGIGDIDVVMASEFMEAGRAIAGGFVTADRTTLIASTSRFYVMNEKIAMGDGRYDQERLADAIRKNAQASILLDMEALAKDNGAVINAIMLGVLAGCGKLPILVETFEDAIKDGKAVDANLRGFRAGLAAARAMKAPVAQDEKRHSRADDVAAMENEIRMWLPAAAQDVMREGVRRLAAYQDANYARLYLDRLDPIRAADERLGSDGKLLREAARHLAVRMSYEDVIRVAQAKIDPARLARIEKDLGVPAGQPYRIVEFLKPGVEEFCQVLPPWLARPILALSQKYRWLEQFHVGMEVNTTSVSGYLRFRMLAALRRVRRGTFRYAQEQAAIESWLTLIRQAADTSAELAMEVAECARLIKGYGSTHKRGSDNFKTIEAHVIRPAIDGRLPLRQGIDAIASARIAALVDPEGEGLQSCIEALEQRPLHIAAE